LRINLGPYTKNVANFLAIILVLHSRTGIWCFDINNIVRLPKDVLLCLLLNCRVTQLINFNVKPSYINRICKLNVVFIRSGWSDFWWSATSATFARCWFLAKLSSTTHQVWGCAETLNWRFIWQIIRIAEFFFIVNFYLQVWLISRHLYDIRLVQNICSFLTFLFYQSIHIAIRFSFATYFSLF